MAWILNTCVVFVECDDSQAKPRMGARATASWLTFDTTTRALSGAPGVANVGSLQFTLWGTDTKVFYGAANSEWPEVDELILRKEA